MKIISHRGLWKAAHEKNTRFAFEESFRLGFGTETDLRDIDGEIVISHDMPTRNDQLITIEQFLQIYSSYDPELPLALNIKSDGLQLPIAEMVKRFKLNNYFLFDMSIPDHVQYVKSSLKTFSRQSEHEPTPALYESASGIWMDEFYSNWISEKDISKHIENNKTVYIVSPELHKREYLSRWETYKTMQASVITQCYLCTDFPEKAKSFFEDLL